MSTARFLSIALSLSLCAAGPVRAQTPATGETGEPATRYRVELLIFRNVAGQGTPEVWLPEPQPDAPVAEESGLDFPAVEDPIAAGQTGEPEGVEVSDEEMLPMSFELLPAESLELAPLAEKLRRLNEYEPLVHVAWVQEGRDQPQALPFHLTGLDASRRLSGTATFWVARFPHLALDLQLAAAGSGAAYDPFLTQRSYRLLQQRRMRRTERHYFDHPQFGVIAVVGVDERPTEAPDPPPPAAQPGS